MSPTHSNTVSKSSSTGARTPAPEAIVVFASVHGHAQTPVVVGSGAVKPVRKPN